MKSIRKARRMCVLSALAGKRSLEFPWRAALQHSEGLSAEQGNPQLTGSHVSLHRPQAHPHPSERRVRMHWCQVRRGLEPAASPTALGAPRSVSHGLFPGARFLVCTMGRRPSLALPTRCRPECGCDWRSDGKHFRVWSHATAHRLSPRPKCRCLPTPNTWADG